MITKPSYILIDEPESNLHPALQIDFLTTLASYASEGILFNTHNIGLARAVADHIYTVQRVDEGESEIRPFEATLNYAELLGALSYSGYIALGFEKVLLVEGPTEVRTIQQFLRHLGLDHKVVLVPMGGSSLINAKSGYELGELARISDRTFALIDSERSTEDERPSPDREGFLDACEKLGIECHMLDRRAIENYFTDGAVKAAMGLNYSALDPYQLLKEKQPQWAKSQGWRIARRMSWKDIEQTDLGAFLQKLKND